MKKFITCTLLFFCLHLWGQEYHVELKSWGTGDGLSDRQAMGIYKDSRGFIWVCTKNGLNLFDGYNFRVFTKEKDGLPFNFLMKLTEDADGLLWVMGSYFKDSNDLFIFDPLTRKAQSFKDKTGYTGPVLIDYIQKMNDSTLFFGNYNEHYFFTWHPNTGLRKVPFPATGAQIITLTDHNTFWIQNDSGKLCELDLHGAVLRKVLPTAGFLLRNPGVRSSIYVAAPGQRCTYKLATDVHVEDGKGIVTGRYSDFPEIFNTRVDSIFFDKGKLYLPDKRILADLENSDNPQKVRGLSQVIIEKNGRIWMSGQYGIFSLTISRSKFRKYLYDEAKETSVNNSYRCLVVAKDILYAQNEFQGLKETYLDTNKKCLFHYQAPAFTAFYSLVKTKNGTIFSLRDEFLSVLDEKSRTWTNVKLSSQYMARRVWKICEVTPDSFLLGASVGLAWFNLKTRRFSPFKGYNRFGELKETTVLDILPDRYGQEWMCSGKGFYKYDRVKGVTERYSSDDNGTHFLPAKEFQHFTQDTGGIYWLATVSGLIRWDKAHNSYRVYNRESGLSNDNIYAVYDDGLGRMWLSSDYGIMSLDKNTGKVRTYLTADGVTNNEFNRVSYTQDSAGNLYFGSLNGVTAFNPKDFPKDTGNEKSVPLSVTTYIQFDGRTNRLVDKTAELVNTGTITLLPGDRFFTINFALLTYDDIVHNTYYWKIEGIDTEWNSTRDPVLRLSGLPYGEKELRIKAQASDGSWGQNELRIRVLVIRPVYFRWWFIVGCILLVLGAFIVWYRWRVARLKRENERLDNVVKEKTAALEEKTKTLEKTVYDLEMSSQQKDILMKEIHHRVKNNLQMITSLLNLQMDDITDDAAKKSIEEGVSRIQSIALIHHQLYQGDKLTSIEMSGFINGLFRQISSVYLQQDQVVRFQNKLPVTYFDIDTALPLGLILNELMTNSFKYAFGHSADGEMNIGLTYSGDQYVLWYFDNGPGLPPGFDPNSAQTLGMKIMKNLAMQLGGGFQFDKDSNCFIVNFLVTSVRRAKA